MTDNLWRASWLNNLKLRFKSALAIGGLATLFGLTGVAFLLTQREMVDARHWTAHTDEVVNSVHELQVMVLRQQMDVRSFLLTNESIYLNDYARDASAVDTKLVGLIALTNDNAEQQIRLKKLGASINQWRESFGFASIKSIGPQVPLPAQATPELIASTNILMEGILGTTAEVLSVEMALLKTRSARLDGSLTQIRWLTIAMLIAGTVLVILLLRGVRLTLAAPLAAITTQIDRLTGGDLHLEVPRSDRRDEIGSIMRALEGFRQTAREVQHREWVKSHASAISGLLSRQKEFKGFSTALLNYLAPLTGAGHAALLRIDPDIAMPILVGGYGLRDHEGLLGAGFDGLTQQCADSGEKIELSPLPQDYVRISSGTGEAPAVALYLWPLPGLHGTAGVLEFATFKPFSSEARDLMAAVLPNIGLALEALSHAIRTAELLEETRVQQEELQASEESLRVQQEELRTTNEAISIKNQELEEQSARLRASEEELRVQAEELRNTYEAMAEKSHTLDEYNQRLLQAQEELQQKNQDIEKASSYKSEFLANMSHELRTPLNSVLILAKDLAENGAGNLNGEQIESAQIIHDSGNNLLRLINDILDLSKIEAGRMDVHWETVQLSDVIAGVERSFRAVARDRNLTLDIQIDTDAPQQIWSDAAKIGQVLTNLVGNALKFTHNGGIRLQLSNAAPDTSGGARLAISVVDSGIGIAPDKLKRLFRAFEQGDGTTSRRYGGTGLGLSISLALARILGGDIEVSSTAGEGSRFALLLPAHARAEQQTRAAAVTPIVREPAASPAVTADSSSTTPSPLPALSDDRESIRDGDTTMLVIEDDPAFSRILADMARQKGYRVLRAADGESGLMLAQEYRPRGILLDIGLPGMDGWAVLDRLKARASTRNIPVHFISATDDAERGMALGAVGFLTKPATRPALETVFEQLLGAGSGERRRVLVIDDDPIARRAIVKLLADTHAEVIEADTQSAAMLALGSQSFDCIVLDLILPDGNGLELLDKLSRSGSVPPVVVHSARDLSHDELLKLREYTDSIVIKGTQSPGRLMDEVSLFLHAVRKPRPAETSTAERPADLAGRHVLVVDDDMRNVFALSKALRGQGLNVIVAQDGQKAIDQLEANPQTDWVLMDIMMPGMDGYTAMRKIRERREWANLPIIALTAKAMRGDREACLQAGANDYLTKPVDMTKLLSMMRAWSRPQ